MGMGHVPQDPLRPESPRADVQGRERGRAALDRDLSAAAGPDLARQARGRWGEEQAARWYRAEGYEIVTRNWRVKGGEVDLVVTRGRLLAFVEVKTRATEAFGDPSLAVTWRKQQRLRRLAAAWLAAHDLRGMEVRFDVVAVLGVSVRVIEGAF